MSPGRRSACVRVGSPLRSTTTRSSVTSATLPERVVVSRASTRMLAVLARGTCARIGQHFVAPGAATPAFSSTLRFAAPLRKPCVHGPWWPDRVDLRRASPGQATRLRSGSRHSSVRGGASLHLQDMTTSATPAMRQYLDAKQQHRDAILFFRMGDFYEMFYEDALVAARALELTLTSRSKDANGGGIPMCGVPFHAVDGYIARLVKKGFRVAICDQVEDPRKAKGIVKREVVRVVSPGTLTDAGYLDAREPAFLLD